VTAPTGVIWARVSTTEQTLGYSLDAQVELLSKAAAERGINVVNIFKIQETGSRTEKRKQFQAMVHYVTINQVDSILIFKIDRLARNYKDFYQMQDLIDKGIGIYVANENRTYDRHSSSSDRFHFRVMGDVAQLEAEQIAERTRLGMEARLRAGQIPWMAPLGYQNQPDPTDPAGRRRTVIIDEARAELVRWAFERYGTGRYTVTELTEAVNREGLRSKAGNHPVSRRCVEELLKNQFYIGQFWDKKTDSWRQHPYPVFISQELFDKVQAQLGEARHNRQPRQNQPRWPLKPYLRCGYCGGSVAFYSPKPGQTYVDCNRSHVKLHGVKRCAESVIFNIKELDRLFTEAMGRFVINDTVAERIKASLHEEHRERQSTADSRRRRLQAEVVRLNRQIDLAYEDRLAGLTSLDRFKAAQSQLLGRIRTVQTELASLTTTNANAQAQGSELIDLLRDVKAAWGRHDWPGKAAILAIMLKRASLYDHRIEFDWQPPFDILYAIGELSFKKREWGE
jgi:site-specific DNA recombinase